MNRFIEKPDCYLDTETGLEWQKGQYPAMFSWEEAIKYCDLLGDGWRLPTRKELFSLVDDLKVDPCTYLQGILSSSYWSSTTHAFNDDYAWRVLFGLGHAHEYSKDNAYYVRAVRSGKPNLNSDKALKDEIAKLKRRLEIINKLSM